LRDKDSQLIGTGTPKKGAAFTGKRLGKIKGEKAQSRALKGITGEALHHVYVTSRHKEIWERRDGGGRG